MATQRRRRRAAARRERLGRRSAWGTGTGWRKKWVLTGGPRASVREREERGELGWCGRWAEQANWAEKKIIGLDWGGKREKEVFFTQTSF